MNRKRSSSSLTRHDVATLPPLLRRRLGLGNPPPTLPFASTTTRDDDDSDSDGAAIHGTMHYNINNKNNNSNNDTIRNSTCTTLSSCRELRRLIHESYTALTLIQRQLYRGEGHYFEESCSHRGNVFQGWDNIWIESGGSGAGINNSSGDVCTGSNSSGNNLQSTGGMGGVESANHPDTTTSSSSAKQGARKSMPPDYRWFSSTCGLNLPIFVGDGSVLALNRPSLSIVGREHDDDDEPQFNPFTPEEVVVKEQEKLEVVNDDDGEIGEGGGCTN